MLKSFNKILAIFLLIMVVLLIWKSYQEQIPYNVIPKYTENQIYNQTDFKYADTVLSLALHLAEVRGVSVVIKELTPEIREKFKEQNTGVELHAAIIGGGSQYILYVYQLTRRDALKVMAHEVIHLMQYNSGRLQLLPPDNIVWESDTLKTYNLYNIPYAERPWEREAFDGEDGLTDKMEEILYGKNM